MQNGCKWRAPHRVGWTAAEVFAYSYGASLRGHLKASNNLTYADVAQLVEHHLAKVRVAGSNPVVRSEKVSHLPRRGRNHAVEWPRGEATDCKSVYTGSNPVSTSGGWRSW